MTGSRVTSPKLAIELPDGSRAYRHPLADEQVPSVTTVIAMYAKAALMGWSDRLGAEYADANWDSLSGMAHWERVERIRYAADRERNRAADLGTAVHSAIESYIKGEPCEYTKEVDPYMTSFSKFVMQYRPEFSHSEVTVWNREHSYAGTADAILSLGGQVYLADFKSGRSLHSEVGMQLSALSRGEFIITPDGQELPMPHIDRLAAIHIRPRSWKFTPVQHDEHNWKAFLACRELHEWSSSIAPYVLGGAA